MSLSLLLFLCLQNKVRLALSRKLCYAVGGVPYQMTNIAMGFSLQIFLLDVVQVRMMSAFSHLWLNYSPKINNDLYCQINIYCRI